MEKSSPRDCVDLLFAREICRPIVSRQTQAGRMVASDIEVFFLLLEMRDLDKLKSKLEINIVWRRECLIPVNILSVVCNHCKNVLELTSRSAILLRVF